MSAAPNDSRILRGMEAQLERRRARLESGEKSVGWKIGFGAPAAKEKLSINAPLIGFMTDKSLLHSNVTVSVAGWTRPVVEPEIAVYLGKDLAGGSDRETTRAAIASIAPALELVDINFPPDDVEAILTENIYHRYVIFGRVDTSRAGGELDGLVGQAFRNGTEIASTIDPQSMTGDLIDNVQHVADMLAVFGETFRAGEVVITGSIVPPVLIGGKEEIRYVLDPVDTISINLDV